MVAIHQGSWLGLPDFGLTEKIGDFFGSQRTTQGGSNIFGTKNASEPNEVMGPPKPDVTTPPPTNNYQSTSQPTNNTSGGGNYSFNIGDFQNYTGWDPTAAYQDWVSKGKPFPSGSSGSGSANPIYSIIDNGYNDYFGKLNDMYNGLDTQAGAQNQIANNSYNQSINDLDLNKQSSLDDLATSERKIQENQVKNLRDISSNIQNQYMAGNVMLGAKGAGDSSAANQYSYALNRLGSQERGKVMNQTASSMTDIEGQKAKLNNIVTQETSRLDTEFGNKKQEIASWLAEQQNAIRQAIANGSLSKSQDIANATQNALNTALQEYNTRKNNIESQKTALQQWAMSNADSIAKLKANMGAIGQFMPSMPTAQRLNGSVSQDGQGNIRGLYGWGNQDETKNLFGY